MEADSPCRRRVDGVEKKPQHGHVFKVLPPPGSGSHSLSSYTLGTRGEGSGCHSPAQQGLSKAPDLGHIIHPLNLELPICKEAMPGLGSQDGT